MSTSDYSDERELENAIEDPEKHNAIAVQRLARTLIDEEPDDLPDGRSMGIIEAASRTVDKIGELEQEVNEIRRLVMENSEQLDAFGDIGSEKTSKEQKIAAVVAFANNQKSVDENRVTVLPKEIKGAAGVSRRYSYNLVDDMVNGDGEEGAVGVDGYSWALDPADQPRRPDQDKPQKGVIVDFEQLHEDHGSVNKFITQIEQKEASA